MNPARTFDLGRTVATATVAATFSTVDLAQLIHRHRRGDVGLLSPEDAEENRLAIKHGDRIFSHYETPHGGVYVITEADRSSTTILFPSEY